MLGLNSEFLVLVWQTLRSHMESLPSRLAKKKKENMGGPAAIENQKCLSVHVQTGEKSFLSVRSLLLSMQRLVAVL